MLWHTCESAIVPRSYRVSHMLGSGSPHPVLTPTPPVIQPVASLQSRDASRRCRQLPASLSVAALRDQRPNLWLRRWTWQPAAAAAATRARCSFFPTHHPPFGAAR